MRLVAETLVKQGIALSMQTIFTRVVDLKQPCFSVFFSYVIKKVQNCHRNWMSSDFLGINCLFSQNVGVCYCSILVRQGRLQNCRKEQKKVFSNDPNFCVSDYS